LVQRFVAYFRVSTARQGRSGLGLEAQQAAVDAHLAAHGGVQVGAYTEIESGRRSDRPRLEAAIEAAKRRKATLVIARLDRLARDVHFVAGLMKTGVEFVACDMPSATPFMLHIYAAVAEEEARAIGARTKAGLQAAKARGKKLGAPDPRPAGLRGAAATRARFEAANARILPLIRDVQASGIAGYLAIARALNEREIKAPRGGRWWPSSVRNLLNRAGDAL
jgi:DNA invertase Pin-like site-specific DNA recombinase